MPSYIIHLSCAGQILRQISYAWDLRDQNLFYLGNIAADMCKDKRFTHFWDDETYKKLVRRPNLDRFLKKYGTEMKNPYVYGYFSHLYLDCEFLDIYWKKHFRFYDADGKKEEAYDKVCRVEVVEQKHVYDREEFFSKKWYYGDYDALNGYFIEKYRPQFPQMDFTETEWEKIRMIEEVDWKYASDAIDAAKSMLMKNCVSEGNVEDNLHVFQLRDLELLLKQSAKKLADM